MVKICIDWQLLWRNKLFVLASLSVIMYVYFLSLFTPSSLCHSLDTHTLTKAQTHVPIHTHTHTHSLSLSLSLSHTHTHTHTHTHIHTHSSKDRNPLKETKTRRHAQESAVSPWIGAIDDWRQVKVCNAVESHVSGTHDSPVEQHQAQDCLLTLTMREKLQTPEDIKSISISLRLL